MRKPKAAVPVGKVLLPGATAPTQDTAAMGTTPGIVGPADATVGGNSPAALLARKKAMQAKAMGSTILGGDA